MQKRLFLPLTCGLLFAACAAPGQRSTPPSAPAAALPEVVTVPERYVSASSDGDELDSLATWPAPDGRVWLIATAKTSHQLVLYAADDGTRLGSTGGKGRAPGRFLRPNGIAVHGDHAFVTERDNRRVQVLQLPDFTPVGHFGEAQLRTPYGLWLHEVAPGELEVFVTDSFMYGQRFDILPPSAELDQRVRRYRVTFDEGGQALARFAGSFGDTGDGALRMVESIAGDPANDRLLIADEYKQRGSTLREYTLAGGYTGRSVPSKSFGAEAEGVTLWSCGFDSGDGDGDGSPAGEGYWIAVDQLEPLTTFHVFDRDSLALVGSFRGETASWTDGITLHAAPIPGFPHGALFAVHADKAIAAFDLGDVARALQLDPACLR